MKRLIFSLLIMTTGCISLASAENGKEILKQKCVTCHDIKGPAAQSLQALWNRKGPDLFYAGSKYKQAWMEKWLVKPSRIRPAGYHYVQHLKSGPKRDMVDKNTLSAHPTLTPSQANAVTEQLMQLKAPSALVSKGDFKGGSISLSFGEMVFSKFNGCMACHEIEPNFGGLSGPEIYTAGKRLQADYMVSFITSPQAWNPKTAMPNKHTRPKNIQKLVQYIEVLAKENWDEKK